MPLAVVDTLPPISPLAREVLTLSLDDAAAEAELFRISDSEPQLAIRLVGVANSVAYRHGGPEITGAHQAIRRIGLLRTKQFAVAILFSQPLRARLSAAFAEDLWLHALAMAAAAQEIARIKRHPDAETAYIAGLVHDLGYLAEELTTPGQVARTMARALDANLAPELAEQRDFGTDHAAIATLLLQRWRAPDALVEALRDHHRDDIAPDSLAAVVYGAEKLARYAEVAESLYDGREHPFALLAIDRLGLDFLFEQQLALTSDEVSQLTARIIDQVEGFRSCARAMAVH